MSKLNTLLTALLIGCNGAWLQAHVGQHPSVHDTVAGVLNRIREQLPPAEAVRLDAARAESFLTPEEKTILGSEHITFRVNQPVTISVLRDLGLGNAPFWLQDRAFTNTTFVLEASGQRFELWQKAFPAGDIGLGVNSLRGGGNHYLVLVKPQDASAGDLVIDQLYPGQLRVVDLAPGVKPYVDRDEKLGTVPEGFSGQRLIRTQRQSRNDAQLVGMLRLTEHPSSPHPDQVVLTWSGDPRTTQTIQWRTDSETTKGYVLYRKRSEIRHPNPRSPIKVQARSKPLEDRYLVNDPVVTRHTVELTGLEPGMTYLYSVGDGRRENWTEFAEFTTAPDRVVPFSFIYMGDAQNGLDRWGTLVHNAFRERPDAAFYLMAGDLVNRGNERDDWDSFFYNARGIYDRRQLVPIIGNHECQGGHPTLYLEQFTLPVNGPEGLESQRAYAFEYSNALFVVLDSNLDPAPQTAWLEQQLAQSQATWKFVAYHHPAYSSAPNRDNHELRELWTPLFDKYHVDLALQGHDHAYLRTYPLKAGDRVEDSKDGTVYIVSVSGTKMYSQAEREETAFGMTNVSTYQVLDIQISGDRLVYRAYDVDGELRDSLILQK